MSNSVLILGNGFDNDLGLHLNFSKWRKSHHCLSHEFSRSNPKGDLWNDFERSLRDLVLDFNAGNCEPTVTANKINLYWQGFWKYLSVFFSEETKDFPDKISVKENCALEVLKRLSSTSCVYTFNYTYPYEYTYIPPLCEFKFVHGRYYKDYYVGNWPMMVQSSNMIIGIDSKRIPLKIKQDEFLSTLIKRQNKNYKDSGIEKNLMNSENIIFFGHSLGITDSDYFDDFFSNIMTSKCQRIYFVTYNKESYNKIKKTSSEWGVDWELLYGDDIKIIPIYTSNGINQPEFKEMLSLL